MKKIINFCMIIGIMCMSCFITTANNLYPRNGANIIAHSYVLSGDGILTNGETCDMSLTIKNIGDAPTNSVINVTLTSNNSLLTIVNETAIYNGIAPNQQLSLVNGFTIQSDVSAENGQSFPVTVTATCEDQSWESEIVITVYRPVVEFDGASWTGNYSSGETINIIATFVNTGGLTAVNAVGTLTITQNVTIHNPEINIGDLDPTGIGTMVFNVTLGSQVPEELSCHFEFSSDNDIFVSGDYSIWTSMTSLEEGFENNGSIPQNWTQQIVTGNKSWTFVTSNSSNPPSSAHGGNYFAILKNSSSVAEKTKLITPTLDLSGYETATLTFWLCQAVWASDQDEMRVFYKTSPTGSWTQIAEYTNNIGSWTQKSITLQNLSTYYVLAFEGTVQYGYGTAIDDVKINVTGGSQESCEAVTDLSISLSGTNTIVLTWSPTSTSQYQIRRNGVLLTTESATIFTDINVSHGSYCYCVYSVCESGNLSIPACASVILYPPCMSSTTISTEVMDNDIFITWSDVEYAVEYKLYRNDTLITTTRRNHYTDSHLDDGVYCYSVSTICIEGESGVSEEHCAEIITIGIEEFENSIKIFPNPAHSQIAVEGKNIQHINIYNVLGQLIETVDVTNAKTDLNVSSYQTGLYIFRIISENDAVISKKVIISR